MVSRPKNVMQIQYDPRLVEEAVFQACRQDCRLESELHAKIDPLYNSLGSRAAGQKFIEVYAAFFEKLKLGSTLSTLMGERPLIEKHVGRCVIRDAARTKNESAELFVKQTDQPVGPADRSLIIQVCPQSLLSPNRVVARFRRDFLHVSDMLAEEFSYKSEALDGLPARQNLIRDRYRVLWDIFVQGRLTRDDVAEESFTLRLRTMFDRVFERQAADLRPVFDRVFGDHELTHLQLLDWAIHPTTLFNEGSASLPARARQSPGEECPLCGFPTHDWFQFPTGDSHSVIDAICASHPKWQPESGACRQCAEIYTSVTQKADCNK